MGNRRAVVGAVVLAVGVMTACQSNTTPSVTSPSPSVNQPTATASDSTTQRPTASPKPTASTPATEKQELFRTSFAAVTQRLDGQAAISVAPVNNPHMVWTAGVSRADVAWSTSKVPLVIAAGDKSPHNQQRAITASDNGSAMQLWYQLGSPSQAASQMTKVLRRFGDSRTVINSRQLRDGFTPFGQTVWSTADQVRFASSLPCRAEANRVFDYMGHISADHRWGLGHIHGAHFKGGWGPDRHGNYVVRQFGVIDQGNKQTAVSIIVWPASGQFSDGIAQISTIADWLSDQKLPSGHC